MCGIAGWVDFQRDLRRAPAIIDAMVDTMACRGPDAAGTWVSEQAAIGHRRLAIIDLSGGTQPMTFATAEGRIVLTYSGEIYNFVELRKDLEKLGHRFTTRSDTEVVLRGYVEWGVALVDRLNGMFAFAIWDERDMKLVMVRDRLGIKPLFYSQTAKGVIFGSEPKAILEHPDVDKVIDTEGIYNLFLDSREADRPPWRGVHAVAPATVVTVRESGSSVRAYWELAAQDHRDDLAVTISTIRALLADTVERQLVADVPRCILLSGGLDSSALSSLAAIDLAREGERVRTFAVDPGTSADDAATADRRDSDFAREVAFAIGATHRTVAIRSEHVADPFVRRAVVTARDSISLGQMDASLYTLFRAIRRESTVALSGEAADELFGGYAWFHQAADRHPTTFPWSSRRQLPIYSLGSILPMLATDVQERLDVRSRTADLFATAAAAVTHADGGSESERRMRVVTHLAHTRHMRMLLDRKDRISMAVGLEVRVPYCDHRLVEYVYNIPWEMKVFDGREKSVLRHAVKDLIPNSVAQRVKSGYPSSWDGDYFRTIQEQVTEIADDGDHQIFSLISRDWFKRAGKGEGYDDMGILADDINVALDLYHLLDVYRPVLALE